MSEERHSQLELVVGHPSATLVPEAVWACDYDGLPATWSNVESHLLRLYKNDVLFAPDQCQRYISTAIEEGEVSVNPTDSRDPLGEWTFAISESLANTISRRYWFWQLDKDQHFFESSGLPGEAVVVRAAVLAYQNCHDLPPTWQDLIVVLGTFGYSEDRAHHLICDAKQTGLITNIMWRDLKDNEDIVQMLADIADRWRYVCTDPI